MKKTLLLLMLLSTIIASAQAPDAVITLSVGQMRAEPDYESPLETQILMGTPVQVIDSVSYWRKIIAPDYTAWINVLGLAPMPEGYIAAPKFICTADYSHVLESPSKSAGRLSDLVMGDLLRDAGQRKSGFQKVLLPDGREGWVARKDLMDFSIWAKTRKPTAENIISTAKLFTGVPYLWGGNSVKGFDCSGLVKLAYFMNGVILPRNSSQMVRLGIDLDVSHVLEGDFSTLREGDLLFFGNKETGRVSHVALYIGGGRILHASQVVRNNALTGTGPDTYENAWRLLYGRRILGTEDAVPITDSPFYFVQE